MAKKKHKDGSAQTEDILDKFSSKERTKEPIFDDPTCIDGAISEADDEEDDEGLDLDWLLQPPTLEVIAETVVCKRGKSWINLTVQYEKQADETFEYEFLIEEVS